MASEFTLYINTLTLEMEEYLLVTSLKKSIEVAQTQIQTKSSI